MNNELFFLNRIFTDEIRAVVDYDCEDGSLLSFLKIAQPTWKQVGIDHNETLKDVFCCKNPEAIWIKNKFPIINRSVGVETKECLLNLNNVFSKVYTYMTPEEIEGFWGVVFGSGYKYITISDRITIDDNKEPVSLIDLGKLQKNINTASQLSDFQRVYGPILLRKQMYQFLMKYQTKENWKRVVCEDYLPLDLYQLLDKIPARYEIIYQVVYTDESLKESVQNDFGITLKQPTHIQMILKNVDKEYDHVHEYGVETEEMERDL